MKTFKDFPVWQKSYQLALKIHKVTSHFPKKEEFGLKSKLRKDSILISLNIAKGFKSKGDDTKFDLYITAQSSLERVKLQTMMSFDLDYLKPEEYKEIELLQNEMDSHFLPFKE